MPSDSERSCSSARVSAGSGSNLACRRPRSPRDSAFPELYQPDRTQPAAGNAQILLRRLAETYDLDLRDLATADEDRFFAELNEIFSDPLFRQIDVPKQELRDLAELCPGSPIRCSGSTPPTPRPAAARPWWRRRWPTATRAPASRPTDRARARTDRANRNYFPNSSRPRKICAMSSACRRKGCSRRSPRAA